MVTRRAIIVSLIGLLSFGLADRGRHNSTLAQDRPSATQGISTDEIVPIFKTDAQWRQLLTRKQFKVTRRGETDQPYSGKLWNNKRRGVYRCVCCELELFGWETKFESNTGWPSFWQPRDARHLALAEDRKDPAELRVEVRCARCDAHLGHVFADGPPPTGLRYCINSAALAFGEDPGSAKKRAHVAAKKSESE